MDLRNKTKGGSKRRYSTSSDTSDSSLTDQPSQDYKKPRTEDLLTEPSTSYAKLNSGEEGFKDDTKLSRDEQEGTVEKRTYASVCRGNTDITNTKKCKTGKNKTIEKKSCTEGARGGNTSCQGFAPLKRNKRIFKTSFKLSECGGSCHYLVTIFTIKGPNVPPVECLKCRTFSENKEPITFFKHEELVVTARTVVEDKNSNPPLCSVFDNEFVQSRERLLEIYWKRYFEYVKNGQHKIDLHGMSERVAKAAVESAVARERQYFKDLRGNADGNFKMLQIITGRGTSSHGSPVLPNAIVNHLNGLGYKKVKEINSGQIEVDVRSLNYKKF